MNTPRNLTISHLKVDSYLTPNTYSPNLYQARIRIFYTTLLRPGPMNITIQMRDLFTTSHISNSLAGTLFDKQVLIILPPQQSCFREIFSFNTPIYKVYQAGSIYSLPLLAAVSTLLLLWHNWESLPIRLLCRLG